MMSSNVFHVSADTRRFYLPFLGLIVLTWGLLVAWQGSAYAELLDHEAIEDSGYPLLLLLAAFLLGWLLMTLAMMLPGSLPWLVHSVQPFRRAENSRLAGLTILAYLFPWVQFGMLVYLGDVSLHHMTEPGAPLSAYSAAIAPAIVLIAGIYQFTPLKRGCARRCRPSHDQVQNGDVISLTIVGALRQGLRMGVFCVGSCWPLMLLMFSVGHSQMGWMLVLSGIMATERLAPWGERLAAWVGFFLVGWFAFWLLALP